MMPSHYTADLLVVDIVLQVIMLPAQLLHLVLVLSVFQLGQHCERLCDERVLRERRGETSIG